MYLSVPRLLGIVAAIEAFYLTTTALIFFAAHDSNLTPFSIFWRVTWPIVLACGAYVLWLDRPSRSFFEALVRSLLIWAVVLANILLIAGIMIRGG